MSTEVILSVEHLMMHFGGIKALSDVSLKVRRNSIFALIGPNGAGKTTVFNCLTGFYKATGGRIELHTRGKTTNVIRLLGSRSKRLTSCRRKASSAGCTTKCSAAPIWSTGQGWRARSRTFACSRKCRWSKTFWSPSTCGSTAA